MFMTISQGCFELLCVILLSSSLIKPQELHKRTPGLLTANFASLHSPLRSGYLTGGDTAPGIVPLTPKLPRSMLLTLQFPIPANRYPKMCDLITQK
jgi:hypothetical protein